MIFKIKKAHTLSRKNLDLYLNPTGTHQNTIIWMHGLGDSAEGFLDVFSDQAVNPVTSDTKVVLLTAPSRSVTINSGMIMPSWYDMKVLSSDKDSKLPIEDRISVEEIQESYQIIEKVVTTEKKKLKNGKLFLGGFSQGCVMSLYVGLENKDVNGIFGFSGYFTSLAKTTNLGKIPIHLFHGEEDDVITLEFAEHTYTKLLKDGKAKFYIEKMLGHGLNMKQLVQFKKLYKEALN